MFYIKSIGLIMKKYLLFISAIIFLLTCEKENNKLVNSNENKDTKVDLVQVDVALPGLGGHGLSIEFNDKSFFFVCYSEFFTPAPVIWNNHFITYLPRGENKISLSKFNFKSYSDSSITYTQDFILGDAEKYGLHFLFDDEFEVIVNETFSGS